MEQHQIVKRTVRLAFSRGRHGRHRLAKHLGAHRFARSAGDQGLVNSQVLHDEVAHGPRRSGSIALLQQWSDALQKLPDQRVGYVGQQGVFIGVMSKEGRVANSGPRGDGANGDGIKRIVCRKLGHRLTQRLACAHDASVRNH